MVADYRISYKEPFAKCINSGFAVNHNFQSTATFLFSFQTLRGKVLENTMAAIYNISLCSSNFRYFQKFQGLDRLLPLMNTPSEKVNMNALFALAYLTDETNNELIMSNNGKIDNVDTFSLIKAVSDNM